VIRRSMAERRSAPAEGVDLRAWLIELDRKRATMRASTPCHQRLETHARQLTPAVLRATLDQGSLLEVERRLRAARWYTGDMWGLDRVWSRAELGGLIVEATNRGRQLLAELLGKPARAPGPRFDPAFIPDERLDALIQRHADMTIVEACRAERARRAQLAVAA
jgi:hypothetical protein